MPVVRLTPNNDTYTITHYDNGPYTIYGLAGDDTITGSTGNDTILGNKGNDTLIGGGVPCAHRGG